MPTLVLSACSFDLGTFEKGDSYSYYYNSFNQVRAKYDDGTEKGHDNKYDVDKSLFNSYTVNNLAWEKKDYEIEERQYVYLIFTIKEVLKVESIALYFKATEKCTLSLSMFYFVNESEESVPTKIMFLSSAPVEPGETSPYNDPPARDANVTYSGDFSKNSWKAVTFENFKQENFKDKYLHTGTNSVIYLRIENNSGLNKGTMSPVTFTFINFMVRAV